MRAIEVSRHGGPEVLLPVTRPEPAIAADDLLVRTTAIGVNFIDTYLRAGIYPSELPYIPGSEGAGTVVALGDSVTEFAAGDTVAWCAAPGSYAELVAVPQAAAVAVPGGLAPQIAASVLLQGMTAHYLVTDTYPVAPGETVLIHAGAGGVGLLATQLATARGARVITTTSSEAKAELSREAGAWKVLGYDGFAEAVRELTDGKGVAATYDGVGAATFDGSLAATAIRGTVALFGAASGPVPPLDPQVLNARGSLFLTRPTLGDYTRDRAEFLARATAVLAAVADGSLTVRIGASFPLADAAGAYRALAARRTTSSVVLAP